MNEKSELATEKMQGKPCGTIFAAGFGCSQAQVLKYVANTKITATTGQLMWGTGRNGLSPLDAIYNLHLGVETSYINLNPFPSYWSYFNPIKVLSSVLTWRANRRNGYHFESEPIPQTGSVSYHTLNFSQISMGQETDIQSHINKYNSWKAQQNSPKDLMLWGGACGTAATFCAFAQEKYPEVKLVVLEGAFDSMKNVLPHRVAHSITNDFLAKKISSALISGLSFFKRHNWMQYDPNGISPYKCVDTFPEGIPVVFITSKKDTIVPRNNTHALAQALVDRGQNDVYVLDLEHSSHVGYMSDNAQDRDRYEAFIHAIYKKYDINHKPSLAKVGEQFMEESLWGRAREGLNRMSCMS